MKGKALLVIEARGWQAPMFYSVTTFIQSWNGHPDARDYLSEEFDSYFCDFIPKGWGKLNDGDRIRVAVTFDITWTKYYDDDVDSEIYILKSRVLRRQPYRERNHAYAPIGRRI